VIIPVYKYPMNLSEILRAIFNDSYKEKEVIIIADEPDDDFLELIF